MKIFIPYQLFPVGGPITFLTALTTALKKRGHAVTHTFTPNFDCLFIIDACSLIYPLYARARGKKIIQRLDGVYYPALPWPHSQTYRLKDLHKRIIHNYFADHVVYQSEFSRQACNTMLGQPHSASSVIRNGVATPALARPPHDNYLIRLVTHASFRDPEQIAPLRDALLQLPPNFTLTIIGPHTPRLHELIRQLKTNPRIYYQDAVKHQDISHSLQQHDIYVFSQLSACPNSVLEALAAGLPVVAYARGGLPELVEPGRSGELVPLRPHNPFYDRYEFKQTDAQAFSSAIQKVAQTLSAYSTTARASAESKFSLANMVASYLLILTRA